MTFFVPLPIYHTTYLTHVHYNRGTEQTHKWRSLRALPDDSVRRIMKLLLAEWHTLDLDLELTALDVLELQSDVLLHLAIGNGDHAVLGKHTVAVFTGRPSVKLRQFGDGWVLILLRCCNQWPDVHVGLPHPVIGAECVLVKYLLLEVGKTSISAEFEQNISPEVRIYWKSESLDREMR